MIPIRTLKTRRLWIHVLYDLISDVTVYDQYIKRYIHRYTHILFDSNVQVFTANTSETIKEQHQAACKYPER